MNAEEILLMKMADIVFVEKRPFCYLDFLCFEHEGQSYKFKHGTIRNIFSKLQKRGDIVLDYRSGPTFYSLPGNKFGKSVTVNHMGGNLTSKQRTFFETLQSIPMDKPAIHDIRLSFEFKHLGSILSSSASPLIKNKDLNNNKDITLQEIDLGDHVVKATVHKTDTVSVIVGCSMNPIPIDLFGLTKLTSSLARVEERLQWLVNEHNNTILQNGEQQYLSLKINSKIPNHMSWIVTMWHFGRDALVEYSGEKFSFRWVDSLNIFHHHIYSKEYEVKRGKKKKKTMKIRDEIQEYPNKPLKEAFMDKLKDDNIDKTLSIEF